MSEFKFACPVCGQHITADSSASGEQLECPTCFQKIIVPQAPSSTESKFILSASQVGKPRPTSTNGFSSAEFPKRPAKSLPVAATLLVLLCAGGITAYFFRDRIFKLTRHPTPRPTNAATKKGVAREPIVVYPVPTNIIWTLDLTNAVLPNSVAAGSIHGSGFLCERSTLQGGTLTLRQGKGWPPDLGLTVFLVAQQGDELSGKNVHVPADRQPPVPRVILRWKDDQEQAKTENITLGGYALKIAFGDATNGRMPGKIYICLPDAAKSVVAGTFDAEIRKPPPPKKGPPKQAWPKQ
jgi:hypothetical protein